MAAKLLSEMKFRGFRPDNITYNTVITACGKGGEWQLARELMDDMRKSGLAVR